MKPQKKGQLVGGTVGLILGGVLAYIIWGFESPGGILILAGFAFGGLAGWGIGLTKGSKNERTTG